MCWPHILDRVGILFSSLPWKSDVYLKSLFESLFVSIQLYLLSIISICIYYIYLYQFVSICQVSRDDLKAPESRPPLMICSSAVLVQMASDLKPSRRSTSTLSVLQRALVFSRLEVSSKTLLQKIKAFSIDWYSRINQFFQGIWAVGIRTTGRATIREISWDCWERHALDFSWKNGWFRSGNDQNYSIWKS